MCGIIGPLCGNASKAFHCLSLRTFAFLWLGVSILVALVQLVAGAYLSSYMTPVYRMLDSISAAISKMEDPTFALKYYEIFAGSIETLWRGLSLLTTVRGVYDIVALVLWGVGWYKKKMLLVYIYIGMTAVDFAIDLFLLLIFLAVINALYVAYFYPAAIFIPFALYGWQTILGPYVLHVLLSHAYVLSVGGNGTEMKSWEEIKDTEEKTSTNDVEVEGQKPEEVSLLKQNDTKAFKEDAEPTVVIDDDDDVFAEPVLEKKQ